MERYSSSPNITFVTLPAAFVKEVTMLLKDLVFIYLVVVGLYTKSLPAESKS